MSLSKINYTIRQVELVLNAAKQLNTTNATVIPPKEYFISLSIPHVELTQSLNITSNETVPSTEEPFINLKCFNTDTCGNETHIKSHNKEMKLMSEYQLPDVPTRKSKFMEIDNIIPPYKTINAIEDKSNATRTPLKTTLCDEMTCEILDYSSHFNNIVSHNTIINDLIGQIKRGGHSSGGHSSGGHSSGGHSSGGHSSGGHSSGGHSSGGHSSGHTGQSNGGSSATKGGANNSGNSGGRSKPSYSGTGTRGNGGSNCVASNGKTCGTPVGGVYPNNQHGTSTRTSNHTSGTNSKNASYKRSLFIVSVLGSSIILSVLL